MAECHPVGFQLGDGGQGARRDDHPRRPALHPHQRRGRHPRADPAGQRHRLPRRHHPLHPGERARTSRSTSSTTPTRRSSCARTSATPRIWTACSAAGARRTASTTSTPGSTRAPGPSPRRGTSTCRRTPPPGPMLRTSVRRRSRNATRRCSIRAACSRSSSATSPATRRRWWSEICGVPRPLFQKVAETLFRNSGRERTAAFCYAVGWTQHSVGVQYIRTAAIIQLLLGNIGRPGGGIMALRGHASIQGSTDIPTLYNLLPGYLPMPTTAHGATLTRYLEGNTSPSGWWSEFPKYVVSLLKAWFGDAATKQNDYLWGSLPAAHRRPLAHDHGGRHGGREGQGLLRHGREPGGGLNERRAAAQGAAQAEVAGGARLRDDRDGRVLEERARGRRAARSGPRTSRPRSSSSPPPPTPRRTAPSPTRSGCCSGTQGRRAAGRLPQRAALHLPPRDGGSRSSTRPRRQGARPCSFAR